MTREQQKTFVDELVENIKAEILDGIEQERLPEDWDGHELRRYLADRFELCVMGLPMRDKRSSRYRQYKNAVLVRGL